MTVPHLLAECRAVGIMLSLDDGGGLIVDGPDKAMTPELLALLRSHKSAIVEALRGGLSCQNRHHEPQYYRDLPPNRGRIKTICHECGRLIGYRPVTPSPN